MKLHSIFILCLAMTACAPEPQPIRPRQGEIKMGVDPTRVFKKDEFIKVVGGSYTAIFNGDSSLKVQQMHDDFVMDTGIKLFDNIEVAWVDGVYQLYVDKDNNPIPDVKGKNIFLAVNHAGVIVGATVKEVK